MKAVVTKDFRDKVTKADRKAGDTLHLTTERFYELQDGGYVEAVEYPTAEEIAAAVVEAIGPLLTPSEG